MKRKKEGGNDVQEGFMAGLCQACGHIDKIGIWCERLRGPGHSFEQRGGKGR